jgi:butyryl-CoA dehydrogenase
MIYVAEALVYRTVGSIDASLKDVNPGSARYAADVQSRIAKYAVECSIVKVWCSEMQAIVVDHALQMYGGYGFTEDYPAARCYRDARINRIFEGTNEINRLIISSWTEKEIRDTLAVVQPHTAGKSSLTESLSSIAEFLCAMKGIVRNVLSLAHETFGKRYTDIQELAGAFADMICEVYALESSLLRAQKNASAKSDDFVTYYVCIARRRFLCAAEKVLIHIALEGEPGLAKGILSALPGMPADQIAVGRRIAERLLKE